ncbi:hypothetical protein [Methylobacterium sp. SI9]|uniref:hypothetical protein n=1 Tax=Methylobacterium guangdongense TaxID=3138811 RepID=UPI00313E8B59
MAQDLIDASNAAAAENAKLQARARCSCPVCDSGPVDVELAARVITALARMPAHVQTDPAVLATLSTIVSGRDIDLSAAYSTNLGLHRPHKVYAPVPLAEPAANTPQEAPVIPTKRRKPTAAEIFAAGGDEGALDLSED